MNPETRHMLGVGMQNEEHTNEVFERLMGTDVTERRNFIFNRARSVRNLDI